MIGVLGKKEYSTDLIYFYEEQTDPIYLPAGDTGLSESSTDPQRYFDSEMLEEVFSEGVVIAKDPAC